MYVILSLMVLYAFIIAADYMPVGGRTAKYAASGALILITMAAYLSGY